MMPLSSLQDLFQRHREGATGQWRLGNDPQRNIFFDQGRIIFAQSTHPLDRLTHLLVEKGRLTQDQMDYAMSNLQPGMSVGKNLIQLGFLTQRDLLDMAKLQVERVVWGAIGTADGTPEFVAKVLDNTVVRLNLDTPALLLGGLLNLQDRERLLELLGPLSQVMVLDRLKLNGLGLPPDLERVPGLINGRRTLLELSRDAAAEPVRLGAFVLFLREMGWGHLQAQPEPSTQDLLNLPLGGEEGLLTPLTVPTLLPASLDMEPEHPGLIPPIITLSEVPAPPEEPSLEVPPLFHSIQAASSPTANLGHLSEALDQEETHRESGFPLEPDSPEELEDEEELALPAPVLKITAPIAYTLESGSAVLPTPRSGLLPLPPPLEWSDSAPTAFGEGPGEGTRQKSRWGVLAGLLLLIGGIGASTCYWWMHRKPADLPPQELRVPSPDSQGGASNPTASLSNHSIPPVKNSSPAPALAPEPKKPAPLDPKVVATPPPTPPPAKPQPVPAPPTPAPAGQDPLLTRAHAQGQAHRVGLPKASWTLRLEIACQVETVQHASKLLEGTGESPFSLPIRMKDGKTCTQIFSGSFKTREEAQAHIKSLPAAFLLGGNKPSPFQVSEIPDKQ